MSMQSLGVSWRRGWRALLVVLLVNLGLGALNALMGLVIPDGSEVRWWVAVLLFLTIGPLIAGAAWRALFGPQLHAAPRNTVVATFSDEASAHIAASALEQSGIRSVVTTAAIGQQSGLPMPVGGFQLVVSIHDQARAESALAKARVHGSRT